MNSDAMKLHTIRAVFVLLLLSFVSFAQADGTPVIIIPGLTGSELVNDKTGELVWLKAGRSKDDDLRLPVSTNPLRARDALVPGDILRSVKLGIFPRTDIYGGLIDSFKNQSGYHEEYWDSPSDRGGEKAIYVFPYDWRLDNVENARKLIAKVEELKKRLKQPNLKFNIIGHSMGGIIARYAAMYGDSDLPAVGRKPVPTWAGAKHFNKIVLLGTPNEGSVLSLSSLISGYAVGGIQVNIPFVQNISQFDVFTIPSSYQLLPAPGTLQVVDEDFEPVNIDIYDPKTWSKYGWNPIDEKKFAKEFSAAERRAAPAFFAAMLSRAKRLHEALSVAADPKGIQFELVGSDCKETLDTIVVYRDPKSNSYKTLFKASGFTKAGGAKITSEELKPIMYGPGDGTVTQRSFEMRSQAKSGGSTLKAGPAKVACEDHQKLGANSELQVYLNNLFRGK
jgi:pimeloyl-ACP methyl ester carboxylesterase